MDPDHKQLVQLLPLLPVLSELARTEHVTATAELLGVPQSTVSRALARAGAVVGAELLVRDGRGVRLSAAARTLLPHVDAALAEFRRGLDLVRQEQDAVRGRIAVSFQHTFGEATLPVLIGAFRERHPLTAFELSQGARAACLDELAAGDADIALTAPVATPGRGLGSAALYREPLRLVLHHQHPAAGRKRLRLEELKHEPFVAMGSGYGLRSLTDAIFRDAGIRPRTAFESQDTHTARGLVSAGLGYSILPPGGLGPGIHGPQGAGLGWVEVAIQSRLAYREIGIAWRERSGAGKGSGGHGGEAEPVRLFREMVLAEGPELLAGFIKGRG